MRRIPVGRLFSLLLPVMLGGALVTAIASADGTTTQATLKVAPIDSVAVQKETQLASRLTAAQRAKLPAAGKELLVRAFAPVPTGTKPKSIDTHVKETTWAVLGSMNGQDVEAMCFLVLMQAAKSAQEDLKAIMAQVKAINDAKAETREQLQARQEAQLKMQMHQDRYAKMVETLSNTMKKLAETGATINQNLK